MIDRTFYDAVPEPIAMQPLRFPVDVVIERAQLANRWMSESWRPSSVESVEPTRGERVDWLGEDGAIARWRVGPFSIELHPVEAEGYFLNLTAPAPCVFIMWRMFDQLTPPARPVVVTVSYNEAGRLLDAGERVDNVPMPETIAQWMRPFVALHYKPEPRRKVRRNDPFAADTVIREPESRE
jgi:Protein of unknown function (DUF3305)